MNNVTVLTIYTVTSIYIILLLLLLEYGRIFFQEEKFNMDPENYFDICHVSTNMAVNLKSMLWIGKSEVRFQNKIIFL